jgi:hypothetical protein
VDHLCARSSSKPGGPVVTTGFRRLTDLRVARPCSRQKVAYRPLELESLSRCAWTRSAMLGPSARPVAIPDDVDAPDVVKARGVIELPLRVRWRGPPTSL